MMDLSPKCRLFLPSITSNLNFFLILHIYGITFTSEMFVSGELRMLQSTIKFDHGEFFFFFQVELIFV